MDQKQKQNGDTFIEEIFFKYSNIDTKSKNVQRMLTSNRTLSHISFKSLDKPFHWYICG